MLALDVGGSKLAAALVDGAQMLWRTETVTPQPSRPDAVMKAVLALIEPALSQKPSRLAVAVTGRVVAGKSYPLNQDTLPGWQGFALGDALTERTGLPGTVLNDARAAAWGEYVYGSGAGASEFLFVTVSTGVGAGLVLGGRLHLSANGLEAELGFTRAEGEVLEHAASGRALDREAVRRGWQGAAELADRAEAGDVEADAPYTRSARLVAEKLADVAALLGVTRVSLGGSVGLRPGYLARVRSALGVYPEVLQPDVQAAKLGKDAGLLGVAAWSLRRVDG